MSRPVVAPCRTALASTPGWLPPPLHANPRLVANITTLAAFFYVIFRISAATDPLCATLASSSSFSRSSSSSSSRPIATTSDPPPLAPADGRRFHQHCSLGFGIVLIIYLILASTAASSSISRSRPSEPRPPWPSPPTAPGPLPSARTSASFPVHAPVHRPGLLRWHDCGHPRVHLLSPRLCQGFSASSSSGQPLPYRLRRARQLRSDQPDQAER